MELVVVDKNEGADMFVAIAVILVVCWLLGFLVFHVSSFLIHILLLVAVISLVWHFVAGRRGA
jgi:hypothetical protein